MATYNLVYKFKNAVVLNDPSPVIISTGDTVDLDIQADIGYFIPDEGPTVSGCESSWSIGREVLTLSNPTQDVYIVLDAVPTMWDVTYNITNTQAFGYSNNISIVNPVILTFTATPPYGIPDNVSVGYADYTYNKDSGVLYVSNPNGHVTITATGSLVRYSVTFSLDHISIDKIVDHLYTDAISSTITLTADDGYILPQNITVTGCEYTYNNGALILSNPYGNITVAATALPYGDMYITLYRYAGEAIRINKNRLLRDPYKVSGVLRSDTDIINPILDIEYVGVPDYNYVYIPIFERYYFVDSIRSIRTNLWRLTLSVDVLMSYIGEIYQQYGLIERSSDTHDPGIIDNMIGTKSDSTEYVINADNNIFPEILTGDFVMTVVSREEA